MNTTRTCRRLFAIAMLAVTAAAANALSVDPQITIDRALNSPTLAVRYDGVTATLIEFRLNGESIGTRTVSASRNTGEATFNLDLESLRDGDNLVEIRLFDRTGKLVGQQKTNISTFKNNKGPVFLEAPKAGASVMGPVEIKVGFGEQLGKSYVSFFVDGSFKSLTNYPPYTFVWDTEKETNGWHDVEAWAIDETNTTHKTGSMRIFVNNPGGRTNRVGIPVEVAPVRNVARSMSLVGAEAGARSLSVAGNALATRGSVPSSLPPAVVERMVPKGNVLRAVVTGANATRSLSLAGAVAMGPKSIAPSITRPLIVKTAVVPTKVVTPTVKTTPVVTTTATQISVPVARVAETIIATTTMVAITRGTVLPDLGTFNVLLDAQPVRFDVAPRVVDGLGLAPLRQIVEKAGGEIEWVGSSKTVRAGSNGHTVELKIGSLNARVDGKNLVLESASRIEKGRTIVPLSFLRDALGMDVEYDRSTGNVVVTTKK